MLVKPTLANQPFLNQHQASVLSLTHVTDFP